MSTDDTIKKINTANILLDAFGDGHEFTMRDYKELAATVNELFGDRYSKDNPCYSVSWIREHYTDFGIEKVGACEIEIMTSRYVYKRVRYNNTDMYYNKYVGRKYVPKTVKQFMYCMIDAKNCLDFIEYYKKEIIYEIDRVTANIEADQKYLEKLKKML